MVPLHGNVRKLINGVEKALCADKCINNKQERKINLHWSSWLNEEAKIFQSQHRFNKNRYKRQVPFHNR